MALPNKSNTNTSKVTMNTETLTDAQSNPKQLEHIIVEKEVAPKKTSDDFSNSIIHFNVGGKKMSVSRKILTMIEGTLLSTMFSDRSDKILGKDMDGAYFLDYDPMLFKHLINQLRYWSINPLVTRVFSSPIDHKNEFISLVRFLKFDENFLSDTFSETVNSNVQLLDYQRLCVRTGDNQYGAYVTGNLRYFQGKHFIKLMMLLTKKQIGFIGIRPANLPIQVTSNKNSFAIPNTFGMSQTSPISNGQFIAGQEWSTIYPINTFLIELDCDSRAMYITKHHNYNSNFPPLRRFFDLTLAKFPWQLFIVLNDPNDYVRIMM